ncbi:hypothetical protein A5892_10395 [Halotalea alkalilenta]|uniref:Uncharacterized protein n=1 Tax=Halotalea alkalilenta TaxID=376489 RepID=A0A172YFH6_9GAMM|nr:hypothetical protein A5892_10395 [Halotalea alkalilenta]
MSLLRIDKCQAHDKCKGRSHDGKESIPIQRGIMTAAKLGRIAVNCVIITVAMFLGGWLSYGSLEKVWRILLAVSLLSCVIINLSILKSP